MFGEKNKITVCDIAVRVFHKNFKIKSRKAVFFDNVFYMTFTNLSYMILICKEEPIGE